MSVPDQAVAAVLSQLALAADGTVLGLALAFIAVRSVLKFKATNSALHQIKEAPSVRVSDLRSVVSEHGDTNQSDDGKLVIVRGTVEGNWKSLRNDVFVGHDSGEKAVIVQRTQMALFGHQYPVGLLHEEKILPLGKDITAVGICSSIRGTPEIKSCNFLPYYLSEMTKDQMIVELAFKTKVLLWSGVVFGSLAIGILSYAAVSYNECTVASSAPPFLLFRGFRILFSRKADVLIFQVHEAYYRVVTLIHSHLICIFWSYFRNWNRWKKWRHQRQTQRRNAAASDEAAAQVATDEDIGDVPDGQLCVICLTRRHSAFVPCGHLVCCQCCALSVVRDLSPDVPNGQLCVICLTRRRRFAFVRCGHLVCCQCCALSVVCDLSPCRQIIHSSVRIFVS